MGGNRKVSAGKFLKNFILDLLFPEYCLACGSFLFLDHSYIACNNCWESYFKEFKGKKCSTCGYPLKLKPGTAYFCRDCLETGRSFSFDGVEYFGVYSDLIDLAIKTLKFERKLPVGWKIGETIKEHIQKYIYQTKVDCIIPVPLHKKELKERGFNQCEEILKGAEISFVRGIKKAYKVERQSSLPLEKRVENVKGIFEIVEKVWGKRILLFDDVFTTGSTVNEISRVLKENGASKVFVYSVARSI